MKEHSLNVLPKWARERIMQLEQRVAELNLYPIKITATRECQFSLKYNGERKLPIHLSAGDQVAISCPNVNLVDDLDVPTNVRTEAEKKLRKYAPHEAMIYIQWSEEKDESLH